MSFEHTVNTPEYNQQTVAHILSIADELPLVRTPDILLDHDLDGLSTETDDELAKQLCDSQYAIGTEHLDTLSSHATYELFTAEATAALPSEPYEPTLDHQLIGETIMARIEDELYSGRCTYAAYSTTLPTGETVSVRDGRIDAARLPISCRMLSIVLTDAYVAKNFTISHLPTSFNGEHISVSRQSFTPVEDHLVQYMSHVFQNAYKIAQFGALLNLYTSELTHDADADLQTILADCADMQNYHLVKDYAYELRDQARAARTSRLVQASLPLSQTVSATELAQYSAILSDLRS